MTKESQLRKVKRVNLKRLTKIENKLFHDDIIDRTNGICQLCNREQGQDFHHSLWGNYGSSKDDMSQVLVCRKCHELCHNDKHGAVNYLAIKEGEQNWSNYNE